MNSEPAQFATLKLEAAQQVLQRIEQLASLSASLQQLTRVYLSAEHLQANQLVAQWLQSAGMSVWQDAVGNICGRYEGQTPAAKALLLGSHLDTVINAGRFDGMLGVLVAIEVVADLHRRQIRLPLVIEIIGFADEEGTRFGVTLLGSKGLTAQWEPSWLQQTDADGVSIATALGNFGLDPDKLELAARKKHEIQAYLELQIEQGPCLEQAGLALGVVQAINGAHRLRCEFVGEAGHAGTVPMGHRRDALLAAAEWMLFVEQKTQQTGGQQVATVGEITVAPGAVNVIPGQALLSLDVRGPDDRQLAELLESLLAGAQQIAAQRTVSFRAETYYSMPATQCCPELQGKLQQAVTLVQGDCLTLTSGAGHDAIAIATEWPVAMLFVRCTKGISHHPAEDVKLEDIAMAVAAFSQAVRLIATGEDE
jgi:allantoate deiminase